MKGQPKWYILNVAGHTTASVTQFMTQGALTARNTGALVLLEVKLWDFLTPSRGGWSGSDRSGIAKLLNLRDYGTVGSNECYYHDWK